MAKIKKENDDVDLDDDSSDGKEPVKSVLFQSLQKGKLIASDDDDDDSDDDEPKPDLTKGILGRKIKRKEEEKVVEDDKTVIDDKTKKEEDFDAANFDDSKFQGKTGETFKKFKQTAKKRDEEIATLKKELETLKSKKTLDDPEVQEIIKERDRYKETVETEYFYNSEDFKGRYEAPMRANEKKVITLISSIKEADRDSVNPLIIKANDYLKEGKEVEFNDVVDQIAEEAFSPTNGAKFKTAMGELFVSTAELANAYTSKEKAKESIDKSKKLNLDASLGGAIKYIDDSVNSFLTHNKVIVDLYESTPDLKKRFSYKEELMKDAEKAKFHLNEFARTGQVSQGLSDFLQRGAQLRARNEEVSTQAEIISLQLSRMKEYETEVKKLKDEVDKLSSTERKRGNHADDKSDKSEENKSGSILARAIKEAGNRK